ncbi:MAG: hypothetical protein ACRCWQ_13210 [Bacilli bacterium]
MRYLFNVNFPNETFNKINLDFIDGETNETALALFEHEYEDIQWEDLHEVDGEIQLNEEHYNSRKQNAVVELLRSQRSPLLLAFDMWKSNVSIGFEEADEELLATVKVWYQGIKDLDTEHLNNVPECIQNYL